MNKLFDHMLSLRIANSSTPAYNIGTKLWLIFTNYFRYDSFSRGAVVIEHFCLWRFIGNKCKAQTIKQNLSHINDYFIKNNKPPVEWYKTSWKLKKFFEFINKVLPPGKGSKPNSESLILAVKKYFNFRNWSLYTSWCSYVLAYGLSMRESEYSETKDYESPKLWQLTYVKDKLDQWSMQYNIPKSKKNSDFTRPEILRSKCVCPMLCVFHTMGEYLDKRLEIHNQLSNNNKQYLFLFEKNLKIVFKDPKKYNYTFQKPLKCLNLQPYKASNASRVWDKVMQLHLKKKKHGHSLHGFRAAGVTDLIALGVSKPAVLAMTRHSNRSTAFQRYVRFTPENTANIIRSKKKEYSKFLLGLQN